MKLGITLIIRITETSAMGRTFDFWELKWKYDPQDISSAPQALFHPSPGVCTQALCLCYQPVPWSVKTPDKCPTHYGHLHACPVSETSSLLSNLCSGDSLRAQRISSCTKSSSLSPTLLKMVNSLTQINFKGVKNWKPATQVILSLPSI